VAKTSLLSLERGAVAVQFSMKEMPGGNPSFVLAAHWNRDLEVFLRRVKWFLVLSRDFRKFAGTDEQMVYSVRS
jgi:hypothetical protein